MGDEEPTDAPPAEEEAAPAEEAAAAGPTVEEVQALAPNDAWEKHPALKEAYDALEDKEGIVAQAEAEEGEEAPAPTWGEKAGEFLEGNKDKFAAGGAPAEEEKPKEPLKKITKVLSLEDVAKVAGEGAETKWADLEKLAGAGKALDKLSKEAMNNLLDCTVPTDVMSFGSTCRDMFTKYGKPRMKKEQMRWNNAKAVYQWEASMGGPLWDFPEGSKTALGPIAEDLVETQFVEQSKKGGNELSYDVKVPTNGRVNQKTYEAIVRRSLGNRLKAKEVNTFDISLAEGGYAADGESTFTVKHSVLEGEKKEVLDRATEATKTQMEIRHIMADLKRAKAHVSSAIIDSHSISERAAVLKEKSTELAEVDASAPIAELRNAAKGPMEAIRETLGKLEGASSWAVFAEKVGGGAGDGKQVEYRKNLAECLGKWLQVQNEAINAAVEKANEQLLEKSMDAANCSADTDDLKVKGAAEPAPEFLDAEDAVGVLDMMFKAALEKSLGDSAKCESAPGDDTVKWTVTLEMDV